ncbi:DUF2972 domain-containing protein, partial [Campylobacter sp. 2457A]|uniref:DUF2972 domain-containing protein n=1 Tax=Campylobacter sp. 2457A TaxID=2735784 RepID=UPI00301DE00F|nr:DUF2972 domain-containing protein [Campylobacter sp. 2457A]
FVFWGSHGVGNFGFHNIMKCCGMIALYFLHVFDSKKSYIEFYNKLTFFSNKYYIAIRDYSPLSTKCFYLIFKISVCLVRDPISCLKSCLNYKWPSKSYMHTVFLNQRPEVFLQDRIAYVVNNGISNKPSLEAIGKIIQSRVPYFHDSSLKKYLKGVKKTHFLDMNEIIGKKTISTIEKLSQKFALEKSIVEDSFYDFNFGSYVNMLPIHINISQHFNLEKELLISVIYKGFNVSYTEIDKQFVNVDKILSIQSDCFSCLVLNEHYNLFLEKLEQKDLIYIKSYIEVLFLAIEKQKQTEDKKRIAERDILNYFKENKELAKEFKRILDTEHLPYI